MSSPYLRFTNGALRVRGIQRIAFQEPAPPSTVTVQTATIPVAEPTPAPVSTPEPLPEPTPAPTSTPEPEPAPAPSDVEPPAEVAETPAESGLVPEDPPA
jgi:hypothetical protein